MHHLRFHGKVEPPSLRTVTHGFGADLDGVHRHPDSPIEFHGPRFPIVPSGAAFNALGLGGHDPTAIKTGQPRSKIVRGPLGGQGSGLLRIGGIHQLDHPAGHSADAAVGNQFQDVTGQDGGAVCGLNPPHQAEATGRIPPSTVALDLRLSHREEHIAHEPLGLNDGGISADFRGAPNLHLNGLRQGDEGQDQKAP